MYQYVYYRYNKLFKFLKKTFRFYSSSQNVVFTNKSTKTKNKFNIIKLSFIFS